MKNVGYEASVTFIICIFFEHATRGFSSWCSTFQILAQGLSWGYIVNWLDVYINLGPRPETTPMPPERQAVLGLHPWSIDGLPL